LPYGAAYEWEGIHAPKRLLEKIPMVSIDFSERMAGVQTKRPLGKASDLFFKGE